MTGAIFTTAVLLWAYGLWIAAKSEDEE